MAVHAHYVPLWVYFYIATQHPSGGLMTYGPFLEIPMGQLVGCPGNDQATFYVELPHMCDRVALDG